MGVRADDAVFADHGFSAQNGARQDAGIRPDRNARPDEHAVGAGDIRPLQKPVRQHPLAGAVVQVEQLDAVVSYERAIRISGGKYARALPACEQALHHARPIGVCTFTSRGDLAHRPKQLVALEPNGAGGDLPDLQRHFTSILLRGKAGKSPVRVAEDAVISAGVFQTGGKNGGRVPRLLVLLKGGADRIRIHQGRVSVEEEHVSAAKTLQKGARLQEGRACAGGFQKHGFAAPLQVAGQGSAVGGNGAG